MHVTNILITCRNLSASEAPQMLDATDLLKINKKGRLFSGLQLRGKDLNLRPLGHEPRETMDALVISTP